MSPAVLHLAPHPDDELIGAPATLMALRDAGWRVVNLACGLGTEPVRRETRQAELREACRRAGFELSTGPAVAAAIAAVEPAIVVSPGPRDRHPAHERVAAEVRAAIEAHRGQAPRWWTWSVWGWLERPTLATGFGEERLEEVLAALAAYRGELARNDYRRLVRGRAEANACLAPELLFGFGATAPRRCPYAELLAEAVPVDGAWRLGAPRWLDPRAPLAPPSGEDADASADPTGTGQRHP